MARLDRSRLRRVLFSVLTAAPVTVLVAGQTGMFRGEKPKDLGVTAGRLKPPSDTRNSVSSQANLYPNHPQRAYAEMAGLPWRAEDSATSIQALVRALETQPGITLIEQTPDYVYAQARTRWLGFVDDLEFWANPATQVIEIRSASRLGQEDMGTNRQRIETLRAIYLER